jgi:hypothetical protein
MVDADGAVQVSKPLTGCTGVGVGVGFGFGDGFGGEGGCTT